MSHCSKTSHTDYGAFELKARYQLHLLYGTLMSVTAVALTILAVQIFASEADRPPPTPPGERIVTVKDIPPPPPISRERPKIETTAPDGAKPQVGIPEPVADELIVDDDVTLATRDEMASCDDPEFDGQDDGVSVVLDLPVTEELPAIDSFVEVEVDAERVYFELPVYPRLAEQAGIEGTVWIKALVLKDGKVQKTVVYKSSGTRSLDEAALDAAKKCRFKPAIQNGRPVAVWVAWPYYFRLNE